MFGLPGIAFAEQSATLTANEPRPIAAICRDLERRFGVAINYEDVRYDFAGDVEDVTDAVLTAEQRAKGNPAKRIVVPKKKPITVALAPGTASAGTPDVPAAMASLRSAIAA